MGLSSEIIKRLREDFSEKAIETQEVSPTFTQTGYKSQYIIERLNDVFGHDCWRYQILEEKETPRECGAKIQLEILQMESRKDDAGNIVPPVSYKVIATRIQWGSSDINFGKVFDAKKGAITNGICKCASLLDIGGIAYKGELVDPKYDYSKVEANKKKVAEAKLEPKEPKDARSKDELFKELFEVAKSKKIENQDQLKVKLNLDESYVFKSATAADIRKYIETLRGIKVEG